MDEESAEEFVRLRIARGSSVLQLCLGARGVSQTQYLLYYGSGIIE